MKSNITVKVESRLLREARLLAAEQGTSLGSVLSAKLEETVLHHRNFQKGRKASIGRLREASILSWTPPASRDELHER